MRLWRRNDILFVFMQPHKKEGEDSRMLFRWTVPPLDGTVPKWTFRRNLSQHDLSWEPESSFWFCMQAGVYPVLDTGLA